MQNQTKQNNSIYLEDLLTDQITKEKALSSVFLVFGYDEQVLAHIVQNSQKVLVGFQSSDDTNQLVECGKGLYLKIMPRNNQFGEPWCYHPKVYLIKFSNFLRVVIGTSNLYTGDWSAWENCCYKRDFSYKESSSLKTQFKSQLEIILEASLDFEHKKLLSLVDININDYDLDEQDILPVFSLPGRYPYGSNNLALVQINTALKEIKVQSQPTGLYVFTSSLGVLSQDFVYQISQGFCVDQMLIEKPGFFRVYYPSQQFADNAFGVNEFGVPLFFSKLSYHSKNFQTDFLYQFDQKENNKNLSHIKMIIKFYGDKIDDNTVIYFGSHNFSMAAWGRQLKNHVKVANLEVGLLWPSQKGSAKEKQEFIDLIGFKFNTEKFQKGVLPYLTNIQREEQIL